MERFIEEGIVVASGLFDWIIEDSEPMKMVGTEFELYRYTLRKQNGLPNLGGAAGDAIGPGALRFERGCMSGQELEARQLPVILREVRNRRRSCGVQNLALVSRPAPGPERRGVKVKALARNNSAHCALAAKWS